jgi:predicted AlkP superfamily phosphohydrolase/phosphomutase
MTKRKVLLLEINEVTWDLIDAFIAQGKLPNFARLKREGAWGTPLSVDRPPQLDPWITWTTVYTGQPQAEHNVFFLQQPADTIKATRIWERCDAQGLKVGVYGSLCSWPPRPVNGFYVPDTFSQDARTWPEDLSAIQTLNLTYTRSVRLPSDNDSVGFKVRLARRLVKLGLGAGPMMKIAMQLAGERLNPKTRWKRVSLQPLVNFAFFRRLYRRYQPDFATFHTNHVAHYQHTYWKAMEPDKFRPLETSAEEIATYGPAIEYGYVTADQLLGNVLDLIDSNTVLVVASSMGQKPFHSTLKGGKQIAQWRSLNALLDVLGVRATAQAVATMSDEFVVYAKPEAERDRIREMLKASYIDAPGQPTFVVGAIDGAIRVNLKVYEVGAVKANSVVHFPTAPGGPKLRYDDVIYNTGHLKSGCHDERGIIAFYGPGIPAGVELAACDNLMIAPTLMGLLGLPIPAEMKSEPLPEIIPETRPMARQHDHPEARAVVRQHDHVA